MEADREALEVEDAEMSMAVAILACAVLTRRRKEGAYQQHNGVFESLRQLQPCTLQSLLLLLRLCEWVCEESSTNITTN